MADDTVQVKDGIELLKISLHDASSGTRLLLPPYRDVAAEKYNLQSVEEEHGAAGGQGEDVSRAAQTVVEVDGELDRCYHGAQ